MVEETIVHSILPLTAENELHIRQTLRAGWVHTAAREPPYHDLKLSFHCVFHFITLNLSHRNICLWTNPFPITCNYTNKMKYQCVKYAVTTLTTAAVSWSQPKQFISSERKDQTSSPKGEGHSSARAIAHWRIFKLNHNRNTKRTCEDSKRTEIRCCVRTVFLYKAHSSCRAQPQSERGANEFITKRNWNERRRLMWCNGIATSITSILDPKAF